MVPHRQPASGYRVGHSVISSVAAKEIRPKCTLDTELLPAAAWGAKMIFAGPFILPPEFTIPGIILGLAIIFGAVVLDIRKKGR